ncbi:helicase [Brachybacterium ginsengisoli]|uniref:Helicase n=1 Tax=Brachybacterium ginsengisoli TaxID=1331682 RepID=A0A291H182_9MICO|nr:DEAD/DEAH box helicase [Brachybacterium ginsengisoli]ATG56239.1 helicase [Brachybacterium ginsengisoli]
MTIPNSLDPGLYELLVTAGLGNVLDGTEASGLTTVTADVDSEDVAHVLTQHIASAVSNALQSTPRDGQIELANRILNSLPPAELETAVSPGPRLLTSVTAAQDTAAPRPSTPLSDVALFTNSRLDPQLGSELRLEMASTDQIDLLCAFVQWSGIRVLEDALRAAADRGAKIRVLTTTYIGATDRKALDYFVRALNAEVRVNYDAQSTHLHAKAWMFHRKSGYTTAYVGSSNMSRAALVDGLEWNVRLSRNATPSLLDKFESTFDTYWDDSAFAPYDPDRDADYLDALLAKNSGRTGAGTFDFSQLDVRPYPHQSEMLDGLEAERSIHDRHRNLLVAATGTGKTVIAALDYKRLKSSPTDQPSLLFIAHRKEILEQALRTYRDVLKDGSFGELFVGGLKPTRGRHVFASVQSIARPGELLKWGKEHFNVVVIDEFHHAEATTYRRVVDHFEPRELLGLTATPERADGVDVAAAFFEGRVASELRLWDALGADLLVPFHYFGIADGVDLRSVRFSRGRYDLSQLDKVYTGNDARAAKVLASVHDKVTDPTQMRALGFCISVDHAHYMAQVFNDAGLPALALSGESRSDERREGLEKLRRGELTCLFAVDLFNEGLDIPMVDTVLMLRPTQSATIFLQQLGRGLRRADNKAVLTVLDFVGLQNEQFRFDIKYRALTGLSRNKLERNVRTGFPFLPPGSQIVFDRVAQDIVLTNIRKQLKLTTRDLVVDVRQHKAPDIAVRDYSVGTYLREAERSLADIYAPSARTFEGQKRAASWSSLVDWAFPAERGTASSEDDEILMRRVGALTHVDDPDRLRAYRDLLTAPELPHGIEENLYAAMLFFSFWPTGTQGIRAGLEDLRTRPRFVSEVVDLLTYREQISRTLPRALDGHLAATPLRSHAQFSREELLAGLGLGTLDTGTPGTIREGVKWLPSLQTDAFLVTLKKSEADYSPTTLYRDYAVNQDYFHWESQSTTSANSATGRRYATHVAGGSSVVLFVRRAKTGDLGTEPYTCLGTAKFESATGSRPLQIVWKLDRAMPVDLFLEAKAAA